MPESPYQRRQEHDPQRQRPHRRHHQLHQHQQPERHARGRPARQEGRRARPRRRSHRQDLARPGIRASSPTTSRSTGLQPYLDKLGFQTVGYGCTTCIGNSGPLNPEVEKAIADNDLVAAAVLSGNRNFEARIHQNIKANFLMSPPLVVAFALAGRVDIDFGTEAIGTGKNGKAVFLKDIWPTPGGNPRHAPQPP